MGGVVYSQDASINAEFLVNIKNWQNDSVIKLRAQLVSTCWDEYHELTTSYPGGYSFRQIEIDHEGALQIGLDMCWSGPDNYPLLGLGRYKISVYEYSNLMDYIYIDYRTSDLPARAGTGIDIGFDYDDLANKIYYEGTTIDAVDETIWNMRADVYQITTDLEPYAPFGFNLTTVGSNPKLTWLPSTQADYCDGYAIYRSIVDVGNPAGVYSKCATLNESARNWTDYDFVTGSMKTAYYKMVATNGVFESDFTSTKSINVTPGKQGTDSKTFNFELAQNYPNPFNPTTTISYSIPSRELVQLKIYNTLGQEVAVLVNGYLDAGVYTTEFNAENLPSSVYIYTLSAGSFTSTRKLLLIR